MEDGCTSRMLLASTLKIGADDMALLLSNQPDLAVSKVQIAVMGLRNAVAVQLNHHELPAFAKAGVVDSAPV